ncbi:MAG: tyrosine-type recombinase/integrase [bacterium]|nr:tyrosine-type recombinase/integrase [bacterium]MDE0416305.1 tyrosine-type recombinase/integrase [bacterium]
MAAIRLTQHRVDTLKPDRKARDIRDRDLRGFGVRILPSGLKRYFLHSQVDGRRIWHTIGDARVISLETARSKAGAMLASRINGDQAGPVAPVLFETVAEEVFRRYGRHWKPLTRRVNLGYYRNQIRPWFKGRAIADVTRLDVQEWFASLHKTPVAADRSAPVLSVIMRQAEVYGYRAQGSNPCRGIRRYRRRGRERFLTNDEIRRLSLALDRHRHSHPLHASIIRLLLLTGCRRSEILTLKWPEYREGNLHLRDSKTGPRTVWLSSPARRILDGLPRSGPWVFPAPHRNSYLSRQSLQWFWQHVRDDAGIADVRLHDLRHTYASVALAHGETILTIGRLLGHNDPMTTLKYTHLADATVHEAAEALAPILGGEG